MTVTIELTRIPDQIAAGATVTYVPDTAKNTSESGNSGRKQMRPLLRNYIVTVSPDYADEMQAIVMTAGTYQLLCIKDPAANTLTDEVAQLALDGITAMIGKTWAPSTGSLEVFERALIIDLDEIFAVQVNGSTYTSGGMSLGDYGVLTFSPPLSPSDIVTVTASYLQVVAMLDAPSAIAFGKDQYQFHDVRLEQIFPAEFIRRTTP